VHVKTIRSQKLRMLLTHRKLLQSKAIAIENDLRGCFVEHDPHHLTIVRDDEVCRRLMTPPGVGPVVALTYRATVDVLARRIAGWSFDRRDIHKVHSHGILPTATAISQSTQNKTTWSLSRRCRLVMSISDVD
jgi:hypothetical protein